MVYRIFVISILILSLYSVRNFAQERDIHGYIDGKIVKINQLTGKIESIILDLEIPDNFTLVDLVFDEANELYYSIANPSTNPKLISISINGQVKEVGNFTIKNGFVYSAEAISMKNNNIYISASLNGGTNENDFYSESILEVNPDNAECTFITELDTNRPFPDIDVMTFIDNELFFFDGAPPNQNFLSFYKFPFENIQTISPAEEIYSSSYIPIADFTYANNQIFFTANLQLYTFDILEGKITTIGSTHSSNEYNNRLVSGLTSVPSCQKPQINFDEEKDVCDGSTYTLNAFYPNSEYLWQDGSTSSSIEVNESGVYSVMVTNECGTSTDSIQINFIEGPMVELGEDKIVCSGYILRPEKTAYAKKFIWSNGIEDSTLIINESGIYSLRVENECGNFIDSIYIEVLNEPFVDLGEDKIVCSGYVLSYKKPVNTSSFRWSNGVEDTAIVINKSGIYALTIENQCGIYTDSVEINLQNPPVIDLGEDKLVCPGYILSYKKPGNALNFTWSNGIMDTSIIIKESGTYSLTIENQCGIYSDSINITLIDFENLLIPNIFTPNEDGKNEYFIIDQRLIGSEVKIFNRYGKLVFEDLNYNNKWDGNELGNGVYYYYIATNCRKIIKGWIEIRK